MLVLSWMSAHVAYGICLAMLFIPGKTVGARFYRLNIGIASVLLAVALLVEQFFIASAGGALWTPPLRTQHWLGVGFVLCVAVAALAGAGVGRLWYRVLLLLAAVSAVTAMLLEALDFGRDVSQLSQAWLVYFLGLLSSAFLLGTVLVAMNLGHWYLVVLDLPFRYLRRFSLIFAISIALKTAVLLVGLFVFGQQFPNAIVGATANFVTGNAFFFWARIVIGIVVPAVLGVMVWQTVKIRSNQSATGLLYVAVVFVLFGELFAKYLLAVSRLPL